MSQYVHHGQSVLQVRYIHAWLHTDGVTNHLSWYLVSLGV